MVGTNKAHTFNLDSQRESIKLTKTIRAYTWEIKLMPEDKLTTKEIDRIESLNEVMKKKFGEETGGSVY